MGQAASGQIAKSEPVSEAVTPAGAVPAQAPTEVQNVQQLVAPLPPPSVEQLTSEAIAALPQLGSHRAAVTKVMTVFSTYVGSLTIQVQKVDLQTALEEIDLTLGWSSEDVEVALKEVMDGVGGALEALQAEFERSTGTAVTGVDFSAFLKRYKDEQAEHAKLKARANVALDDVRTVSGRLGITNPDPGAQPQKAEKKETALERVGTALAASGRKVVTKFFVEPASTRDKEEQPPSWQTEPVLAEGDRDLRQLALALARSANTDVTLAWSTLERLSLGRENLTAVLARVAEKAREQLRVSAEILGNVETDYQQFAGRIKATEDVRQIILATHDFFFPGKG